MRSQTVAHTSRSRGVCTVPHRGIRSSPFIRYHRLMADWERLARYVVDGRVAKGWSQEDLARAAGLKQTTVSAVETAKGKARPATLAAIGHALGWRPGSADRILVGGEPAPTDPDAERAPTPTELRRQLRNATNLPDGVIDQIVTYYSGYWEARREIDRAG